uniref:Trypsin-like peptidase domain protein n=1 Tax=Megaviridae environmental sample TaxID=1737588 RepID=A0A5J6VK32_9VIRU|nr:MAG: trypsin-like peptidase domain protein [Megaviridae environmental sample]
MDSNDYDGAVVKIHAQETQLDYFNPYIKHQTESTGSGFIIEGGYIVTCMHVIGSADNIFVTLPKHGKEPIKVEITSMIPEHDIGLLRIIDDISYSVLEIDSINIPKQRDQVIAVGFPLGQDRLKFTTGIMSGMQDRSYQIDAAINPGNSGGPLLNSEFKVIGINASKMTNADNIGYAAPIKLFTIWKEHMLTKSISNKIIRVPRLHITFAKTNKQFHEYKGSPSGIQVTQVLEKSPFYNIITPGDVLMGFDSKAIDNYGELEADGKKMHLIEMLMWYIDGSQVTVNFYSISQHIEKKSTVTLRSTSSHGIKRYYYPHTQEFPYFIFGGIIFAELTKNHLTNMFNNDIHEEQITKLLKYNNFVHQENPIVFIANIINSSFVAINTDLIKGEIVTHINNKPITNIKQVISAINNPLKKQRQYLLVKTSNKTECIVDYNTLIQDDKILSKRFDYTVEYNVHNDLTQNR